MCSVRKEDKPTSPWLDRSSLLPAVRAALSARKWVIVTVTLLTFTLTATATFLARPSYVTSATILLRKERIDAPVTPEQTLLAAVPERRLTEEELNSEVEILRSDSLLEEVIDRLHLEQAFEEDLWSGSLTPIGRLLRGADLSARARALLHLQTHLTIEPVKRSNIIRVSYKTTEREMAARVVNTLCEAYQRRHVQLHQSNGAKNFFAEQARAMQARLRAEEEALERLSPLPSAELLKELTADQLKQLNEFEVALQATRTALAEGEARIKSLTAQLEKEPERLLSEERVTRRVAPDAVRAQLFALELRRAELLTRYPEHHRLVQDVNRELAEARQLVAQLEASPSDTVKVMTLNSLHQSLSQSLSQERSALAALKEKERALAEAVQQRRERVRQLSQQGYQRRQLDREREIADSAYLLYARKGEEARISAALDREGIINVRIAEPARAPLRPASPNVRLNLLLGLLGGLLLSLGTIFVLEYFEPSYSNAAAGPAIVPAAEFQAPRLVEQKVSIPNLE